MSKLHALPAQAIIDGLKGVIDYYVHYQTCDRSNAGSGTPCARSWPRSPGQERAPAVEAQWAAFAYAAKNWNSLDPYVQEAYKATVQETNLTPRDLFTKAFITDYFREGQWYILPFVAEERILMKLRAYLSGSQSIPHGVATIVELDAETYDTNSVFNTATHRFTATVADFYSILATVCWFPCNVPFTYEAQIYKNGAAVATGGQHAAEANGAMRVLAHDIIYLEIDDFIELYAYQNSGVARDVFGAENSTFLSIASLY